MKTLLDAFATASYNTKVSKIVFLTLLYASLAACSFVDSIPGSETIVLSNTNEHCHRVGETHVKVLDSIIGFDRDEVVLADELATLARNAAVKQGGNTISPSSEIIAGEQSFIIYRCR